MKRHISNNDLALYIVMKWPSSFKLWATKHYNLTFFNTNPTTLISFLIRNPAFNHFEINFTVDLNTPLFLFDKYKHITPLYIICK